MKIRGLSVIVILFCLVMLPTYAIKNVEANPLTIDNFSTGNTVVLAENVSMPVADVNITVSAIKHTSDPGTAPRFDYTIVMDSEFKIESTTDQNSSIAFAYPESWGWSGGNVTYPNFEINFEDNLMTYLEFDGADFDYDNLTEQELEQIRFLPSVRLAIINVSLIANTIHTLNVHCDLEFSYSWDILRFRYCVGSARAWTGHTQETVRMQIENVDLFKEVSFGPNEDFVVQSNAGSTTGTWSLNFPDFEDDYLTCEIWQSQYPYDDSPFADPNFTFAVSFSVFIIIAISISIIVKIIRPRFQKSI